MVQTEDRGGGTMNQEDLLEYIQNNPGILQTDLKNNIPVYVCEVSSKLYKLRLKKLIRREYYKGTWRLYPI